MPESGAFTDDLVKKVYEVAGKGEPPVGHIFVRQEFGRVFDAPVGLTNPDEPLGTHVYTAMKFAPGDTKTRWMAVTVQGGSPEEALDRIQIPDDIRQRISERLTPGSTLIIGDTSINAATPAQGRRLHGACQVQLAQDGERPIRSAVTTISRRRRSGRAASGATITITASATTRSSAAFAHTRAGPGRRLGDRGIRERPPKGAVRIFGCGRIGAGEGIRTLDPNLGKVVLYP